MFYERSAECLGCKYNDCSSCPNADGLGFYSIAHCADCSCDSCNKEGKDVGNNFSFERDW